jgi:hypothetical protein
LALEHIVEGEEDAHQEQEPPAYDLSTASPFPNGAISGVMMEESIFGSPSLLVQDQQEGRG